MNVGVVDSFPAFVARDFCWFDFSSIHRCVWWSSAMRWRYSAGDTEVRDDGRPCAIRSRARYSRAKNSKSDIDG